MKAQEIVKAIEAVTKEWTKRRKKEERKNRPNRTFRNASIFHTDVAGEILPKAYAHGSGDGKFTLAKRNFYYAAREHFAKATGKEITYDRFKTILLQFMNRNPKQTAEWKITADPRGTFWLPNTAHATNIPVGTIQIDNYLSCLDARFDELNFDHLIPVQWPLNRPSQRFSAVLYIEKEGFGPMLQEARIAERFDLAIVSCKGQSVVAARKLVDHLCRKDGGVPLFVVHDFDKAGFEILNNLTQESQQAIEQDRVPYYFENEIDVHDFGLRLEDGLKYKLQPEFFDFKGELPAGLTDAEYQYLSDGFRIELNAFTCPQFIEWLESKLIEFLPEKLVPESNVLARAYRRAFAVQRLNAAGQKIKRQVADEARSLKVPRNLLSKVKTRVQSGDRELNWDMAVAEIAAEQIGKKKR